MPEHQESNRYETSNENKYGDGESRDTLTLTRKSANVKLRGTANWKALMKSFSEANKETCKSVPIDLPLTHRSLKKFPTGSNYEGTWNLLGMSGEGTYTFSHEGVVYKGGFDDGAFHGDGSLFYENGAIIRGKWNKGKLTERHLFFADDVETDWAYCRPFDRRFTVEYDNGLEPADQTYKTAEQPTPPIPFGFYDVGDGLYDPATKTVYKFDDLTSIVRSPSDREAKWIEANCRVNPDLPKGPCPFLYEEWLTPTLEVVPEPPPPFRRSTCSEELVDELSTTDRLSKNRGKLYQSRIGFGSKTAFYDPHYGRVYSPGGSRYGVSSPKMSRELKNQSNSKQLASPKASEFLKVDPKKASSVGFRMVRPEANETIFIKAHEQDSEKYMSTWALSKQKQEPTKASSVAFKKVGPEATKTILIKAYEEESEKNISEWALKQKQSDTVAEYSSDWNVADESDYKHIEKDDTANIAMRNKDASSWATPEIKQTEILIDDKHESTQAFISQSEHQQFAEAGAQDVQTDDLNKSTEGPIELSKFHENTETYVQGSQVPINQSEINENV